MRVLSENREIYGRLERLAEKICRGLEEIAERARIPVRINRVGSMWMMLFAGEEVVWITLRP